MKVEYQVRPVTRYIVTSYTVEPRADETHPDAVSRQHGEFDNHDTAYAVAYALCKQEHERLGYAPGDERIQYPRPTANHDSDCAVNNAPAMPPGPCDCRAATPQ